jgi:hypothetical protein
LSFSTQGEHLKDALNLRKEDPENYIKKILRKH